MRRFRIGVWGLGRIGRLHAENVASSAATAELVAVADPIKKLAQTVARRLGARMYDSPARMLKEEKLDGVVIATPTPLHREHVVLACEARLPMMLEKPIAMTLEEADKIVSAVKRSRAKLIVGFDRRFDPGYRRAKQMIVKGKVGKPLVVKTCARDPMPPPDEYIKVSGGIFVDECIHDIDMALWLMNSRVNRVSAIGKVLLYPQFRKHGDYDNAVAILEFESGGLGIIEGSRASKYGYDLRTEVLCSEGAVRINNWKEHSTQLWTKQGGIDEPYPWFMGRFAEAYRRELDAFYEYIRKGGESPVSVEEGRAALQVAIAARESAKKGKSVILR
jgi:inositol 2-dehydrogenase